MKNTAILVFWLKPEDKMSSGLRDCLKQLKISTAIKPLEKFRRRGRIGLLDDSYDYRVEDYERSGSKC